MLIYRAVQEPHLRILDRAFHAGCDQLRRCGKHHIRAFRHRKVNEFLCPFRGIGVKVGFGGNRVPQCLFQIFSSALMGLCPVAGFGIVLMDKCHLKIVYAFQELDDHIFLLRRLGFYHRLRSRHRQQIRPQLLHRLFQFSCGQISQISEGIHLQPHEESFLWLRFLTAAACRIQRLGEVMEVCPETAALLLCPYPISRIINGAQQLGIASGHGKTHIVQTGQLIKFQKFRVSLRSGSIRLGGHNAFHIGSDAGRTKIPQHADPLITLLHIEIAHIFIALNGILNSLCPQMGNTQIDPLGSKLRIRPHQRQETG